MSLLSPIGKRRGPSIEQTLILFTQGCFMPSLVEIVHVVLGEDKHVKNLRRRRQREKLI